MRASLVPFALFAAALLVAPLGRVHAEEPPRPYRFDLRVAYVKGALLALTETPPVAVQKGIDHARALARGPCSAGAQRLRVECLMIAVTRYCEGREEAEARRCRLAMDVLVSNVLADERLIPPAKRYQIMRDNQDYRAALARELRRIQGALAVDFRLQAGESEDVGAMAADIDRYCLATADDTSLPYQTCVASLVWFIKGPT